MANLIADVANDPEKRKAIICNLETAFEGVQSFVEYVGQLIKKIRALLKKEKPTSIKSKLQECKVLLQNTLTCVKAYMKRVETMLRFAVLSPKEVEDIVRAIKSTPTNKADLIAYSDQVSHYLKQVGKLYDDYKDIYKEAKKACKEGLDETDDAKKNHAAEGTGYERAGNALWYLGAAATTGGIIGAATVAGFFTAGLGTPFVLGFSALASGGATVGGMAAGAGGNALRRAGNKVRSTKQYHAKSSFLEEISEGFAKLNEIASGIDQAMFKCDKIILQLKMDVENEKNARDNKLILARAFRFVVEGFRDARKEIQICNDAIKRKETELEAFDI